MCPVNNEQFDQSTNVEPIVSCIYCSWPTKHEIVRSFDQSEYVEEAGIHWESSHQIIRCKGCGTLSFRRTSSNSDDYENLKGDVWELTVYEDLFPPRIEGRKNLGQDVHYLPTELKRIYSETNKALDNNLPVLAGIGLRALVETVCKEKKAEGRNLFNKINDLKDKHVLTPAGSDILHKIRALGNDAAHEVKPHTPQQLALAMTVVEHMLKDVYILPKLVEDQFE